MNTDYSIGAIEILLNEDCVLKRFYPLIPYKDTIIKTFNEMGFQRKSEIMKLSDEDLMCVFSSQPELSGLFRAFLKLYDTDAKKMREIDRAALPSEADAAFRQFFLLPGVRTTRATLYFKAGFRTLEDIASSSPEEMIEKTAKAIKAENLSMVPPLMKEVKTHIAVSKAFTSGV